MFTYPSRQFKRVKSIIGATAITNVATSKTIANRPCTVICLAGNLWINPITTAVANATAIKMTTDMQLDLAVYDALSLISDGSGATVEIIIWEE